MHFYKMKNAASSQDEKLKKPSFAYVWHHTKKLP